ncbi:unnamed protein product, partial [Prorocentrum cordatum]
RRALVGPHRPRGVRLRVALGRAAGRVGAWGMVRSEPGGLRPAGERADQLLRVRGGGGRPGCAGGLQPGCGGGAARLPAPPPSAGDLLGGGAGVARRGGVAPEASRRPGRRLPARDDAQDVVSAAGGAPSPGAFHCSQSAYSQ